MRLLAPKCNTISESTMKSYDSPLHLAAGRGHMGVTMILINDNPNESGCDGRTLLHSACIGGNIELVNKLISDFNFNPLSLDDNGFTSLDIAALCGQGEVVKVLVAKKVDDKSLARQG